MALIPEYKSIDEKKKFFDYEKIDNISEFEKIEKFNLPGHFFRGMHEAKYKNYTSGQRAWVTKELWNIFSSYEEFVLKSIHEAKQYDSGLLFNFLYPNINDFAFLAFLQHYGAPTPLIDFTHDFYTGVFFSTDGLRHFPSSNEIDNYFSIYALPNKDDLFNLKSMLVNGLQQVEKISADFPDLSAEEIQNHIFSLANPDISLANEMNSPFYVSFSNGGVDKEWEHVLKVDSNLNIIAQKGLLVNNPLLEKPLEEIFDGVTFEDWQKENPGKNTADRLFYPKIKCLDIHKSLEGEVLGYLKKNNITRERMYPEEERVVKTIMNRTLIK